MSILTTNDFLGKIKKIKIQEISRVKCIHNAINTFLCFDPVTKRI